MLIIRKWIFTQENLNRLKSLKIEKKIAKK